ncbi:MAG: response regulator transcription factor [Elusimicrobia bacterium]|nr:response regulator transcription factor [Elusimicrobiota bacterium]
MRATDLKRTSIRVFLVDDHPLVREGVRSFLTNHSIAVVGEAGDAKEALRKVKKLAPDVVVLDVNLPSIDGGELARRLRRLIPKTKLVAFSMHSSEAYVVKMARCGVQGYVTKDQPPLDLVEAIKHVYEGGLHFPEGMTDALLTPAPESSPEKPGGAELTDRELEVLTLLAEGLSNKGIAAKLGISVRTAETHRENLSHKLNILTVAGLTKYALQRGLTSLGAHKA